MTAAAISARQEFERLLRHWQRALEPRELADVLRYVNREASEHLENVEAIIRAGEPAS